MYHSSVSTNVAREEEEAAAIKKKKALQKKKLEEEERERSIQKRKQLEEREAREKELSINARKKKADELEERKLSAQNEAWLRDKKFDKKEYVDKMVKENNEKAVSLAKERDQMIQKHRTELKDLGQEHRQELERIETQRKETNERHQTEKKELSETHQKEIEEHQKQVDAMRTKHQTEKEDLEKKLESETPEERDRQMKELQEKHDKEINELNDTIEQRHENQRSEMKTRHDKELGEIESSEDTLSRHRKELNDKLSDHMDEYQDLGERIAQHNGNNQAVAIHAKEVLEGESAPGKEKEKEVANVPSKEEEKIKSEDSGSYRPDNSTYGSGPQSYGSIESGGGGATDDSMGMGMGMGIAGPVSTDDNDKNSDQDQDSDQDQYKTDDEDKDQDSDQDQDTEGMSDEEDEEEKKPLLPKPVDKNLILSTVADRQDSIGNNSSGFNSSDEDDGTEHVSQYIPNSKIVPLISVDRHTKRMFALDFPSIEIEINLHHESRNKLLNVNDHSTLTLQNNVDYHTVCGIQYDILRTGVFTMIPVQKKDKLDIRMVDHPITAHVSIKLGDKRQLIRPEDSSLTIDDSSSGWIHTANDVYQYEICIDSDGFRCNIIFTKNRRSHLRGVQVRIPEFQNITP